MYRLSMAAFHQLENAVFRNRIMVIGQNVITVQQISRYCLEQEAEVFPYYGMPTIEEVILFDPEILVLCVPVPESFLTQIDRPYILWSETQWEPDLPLVSTQEELEVSLQAVLQS
jgi:hypothetical protein